MNPKKAKMPILPSSLKDPTGVDSLERAAMREFKKKITEIGKSYKSIIQQIPSSLAVNARYVFNLDVFLFNSLLDSANALTDRIIMDGGANIWLYQRYVSIAYQRGTAQENANLSRQSESYARQSLSDLLMSDPYRFRMALVRARVFEQMQGLSADIKKDMALVLTDGIGRGQSPRIIARRLSDQVGIETRRAYRIARTEITTALRRARWDETDEASSRYGFKTKMLHLSALSPTTRRNHALRHGMLFTADQVRDWYSKDANAINCKCSQIAILVNDKGEPLDNGIIEIAVERLRRAERKFLATNIGCGCCKDKAA